MKELERFLTVYGHRVELGLIVFGSYIRDSVAWRDIDLLVLTESGSRSHELWEDEGIRFDVHFFPLIMLKNAVFAQKNMFWLRNLFASKLYLARSEEAQSFYENVQRLREQNPRDFFGEQGRSLDRKIIENYLGKIAQAVDDVLSFSYYTFELIRRLYFWECLDRGLWPSADPRFIRRDISRNFSALHRLLLELERSEPAARQRLAAGLSKELRL